MSLPEISKRNLPSLKHRSQETVTSTIADSTISVDESFRLHLAQFPQPPSSAPSPTTTPGPASTQSIFQNTPSQRKKQSPTLALTASSSDAPNKISKQSDPERTKFHKKSVSPYDWHDGASSIGNGINPREDKLLSTSFITSLLAEGTRPSRRASMESDAAMSGFSEITYPPISSLSPKVSRDAPSSAALGPRLQAGKAPSFPCCPLAVSSKRLSIDSDTLYSWEHGATIAEATRGSRVLGARVVNVAPATIRSVDNGIVSDSGTDYPHTTAAAAGPSSTDKPSKDIPSLGQPSFHSTKSSMSSFISHLSIRGFARHAITLREKPLPPQPLIPNIPIEKEIEHRKEEANKTLSDLVRRASTLQNLLEKGYLPHLSPNSDVFTPRGKIPSHEVDTTTTDSVAPPGPLPFRTHPSSPVRWSSKLFFPLKGAYSVRARRIWVILLIVLLALIATVTGVVVGRRKHTLPTCPYGFTGAACDLNSTCVCTSSSGQCDGLSRSVVDLIPSANRYFSVNYTESFVYKKISAVQGSSPADCAPQARLIDTPPVIDPQTRPDIVHWSRAALLWNLVESQDLNATATLQHVLGKFPWNSLNLSHDSPTFSTIVSGYTFDFVMLQVTQQNASFVSAGQPTAVQLSRVDSTAHVVLDKIYTFAQAASIQHHKALEIYWTTVLQQKIDDLSTFISALTVSPILLPFDATSQSISALLTATTSTFPPPLGCYPGLQASQIQQVNAIETTVFGLAPISDTSDFIHCYPDRPIYGVLDVLRLRLPFVDSKPGVPMQAAVLSRDVSPRVVMHNGAILNLLPGPSNVTEVPNWSTDPRRYGTLGFSNHVILQYLSSIPDVNIAIALVGYVLASAAVQALPPTNTSILFQSLSMIPDLEVAIFGSVLSADIVSAVSSFTTSDGSLFFGSDQGNALRSWVISSCNASIAWTQTPLSPLIVRDSGFSDPIFQQTWQAASTAIQNDVTNVGLSNVTESFAFNNKFTLF